MIMMMFTLLSVAHLLSVIPGGMADSSCGCASSCTSAQICQSCVDSGGLCEKTKDPLYCSHLLTSGAECYFENQPCDSHTNLSYGCYNGACYSQCVGAALGDNEWCWVMPRARGVAPVEIPCTESADCNPDNHDFKCSNSCN